MEHFTNQPIDLDQLPKYEETPLTLPHPKYWAIILINLSTFLLLMAVGLVVMILVKEEVSKLKLVYIGAYLLLAGLLFLVYKASFKRRGFALREKDVIYKSGIIAETTTIIPLNRIQHVALKEGILSRMFGLGTLEVFTAGGHSGHMHIAGIEIDKAKVIKEALVKRIDLATSATKEDSYAV